MSTNPDNKAQLTEIAKAVGVILGVPLALFTAVNNIFGQPPHISLIVALITAGLVSIWVILSHWVSITQIITAWLALAVVVLAGFVIWPKTMTVEGFVYDTARDPVSNEQVVFFDRSGRRYETQTDVEGHYKFIEVPSGKYRVQVRTSEVEGETRGILVRVVQQNLAVSEILITASPTSVVAVTPDTPTATPVPPASTPTVATVVSITPTPPLPECNPNVIITSPREGEVVSGAVTIMGTAQHKDFYFYKVEYGMGKKPTEFIAVSKTIENPVNDGVLDTWDTSVDSVKAGEHTLKLTVVKQDSNEAASCTVVVNVKK